jgi:hypothetical protein
MCSDKHYEDTWFIVVEEDWRLSVEHVADASLTMRSDGQSLAAGTEARAARGKEFADVAASSLSPSRGAGPLGLHLCETTAGGDVEFLGRTFKTTGSDCQNRYVSDLVKIAAVASRKGVGDLVWYSWEPGQRKSHPGHGSTLVGWSVKAAQVMSKVLKQVQPDHMDLILVGQLVAEDTTLSACYTSSSMGNYATHVSGCEGPANWVRESTWRKNILQDTRAPKGEKLWLGRFQKKGVSWVEPPLPDMDTVRSWRSWWDDAAKQLHREAWSKVTSDRGRRQMRLFDRHLKFREWVQPGPEEEDFSISWRRCPCLQPGRVWVVFVNDSHTGGDIFSLQRQVNDL